MASGKYKKTEEHRNKISLTMRGHSVGDETRKKIGDANRGRKLGFIPKGAFKKGMTALNKGKRMSEAQREKLSGENSPNWKGGVTPIHKKIRKSLEYQLWRNAVFARDGWRCIWCGQRGGRLQADHIKPFARYPALRFAIDNGRTLCVSCHKKTDTYGWKSLIRNK